MVSEVYMICDAYESGVGKGMSGEEVSNPYSASGPVNERCHEAWQIGYEFGQELASEKPAGDSMKKSKFGDRVWYDLTATHGEAEKGEGLVIGVPYYERYDEVIVISTTRHTGLVINQAHCKFLDSGHEGKCLELRKQFQHHGHVSLKPSEGE